MKSFIKKAFGFFLIYITLILFFVIIKSDANLITMPLLLLILAMCTVKFHKGCCAEHCYVPEPKKSSVRSPKKRKKENK